MLAGRPRSSVLIFSAVSHPNRELVEVPPSEYTPTLIGVVDGKAEVAISTTSKVVYTMGSSIQAVSSVV